MFMLTRLSVTFIRTLPVWCIEMLTGQSSNKWSFTKLLAPWLTRYCLMACFTITVYFVTTTTFVYRQHVCEVSIVLSSKVGACEPKYNLELRRRMCPTTTALFYTIINLYFRPFLNFISLQMNFAFEDTKLGILIKVFYLPTDAQ
jgi:hypothetical protein